MKCQPFGVSSVTVWITILTSLANISAETSSGEYDSAVVLKAFMVVRISIGSHMGNRGCGMQVWVLLQTI